MYVFYSTIYYSRMHILVVKWIIELYENYYVYKLIAFHRLRTLLISERLEPLWGAFIHGKITKSWYYIYILQLYIYVYVYTCMYY